MNKETINGNIKVIDAFLDRDHNGDIEKLAMSTFESLKYSLDPEKSVVTNELFLRKIKSIIEKYPEFLSAPASIKYHGNYIGGLIDHSFTVYKNALLISESFGLTIDDLNPIAIIFHDLCKCNRYVCKCGNLMYNNEYIGIEHGAESLRRLLLIDGVKDLLPDPWQLAIAYHMGTFDKADQEIKNYSNYCERFPEVLLLHHADMMAAKINKI